MSPSCTSVWHFMCIEESDIETERCGRRLCATHMLNHYHFRPEDREMVSFSDILGLLRAAK